MHLQTHNRTACAFALRLTILSQSHVFYMGYVGAVAQAASLDECGDVCAATNGCLVANYMKWNGGTCSMNGWGFPVAAWGVSWDCDAAFATGSAVPAALAHPPAPCVIETHGPYIGCDPARDALVSCLDA